MKYKFRLGLQLDTHGFKDGQIKYGINQCLLFRKNKVDALIIISKIKKGSTSKRVTCKRRYRIEKRIKDHNKKSKKEANKNFSKKSKSFLKTILGTNVF